jgi:hypothetical protein
LGFGLDEGRWDVKRVDFGAAEVVGARLLVVRVVLVGAVLLDLEDAIREERLLEKASELVELIGLCLVLVCVGSRLPYSDMLSTVWNRSGMKWER